MSQYTNLKKEHPLIFKFRLSNVISQIVFNDAVSSYEILNKIRALEFPEFEISKSNQIKSIIMTIYIISPSSISYPTSFIEI